ncbi:MAG: TlpA disulfide reductase family protein [Acidobacteriota bacterium]
MLLALVVGLTFGLPAVAPAEPTDLSGQELTAADLAAGDSVIVVWAPWSPRCRDVAAPIRAIKAAWGERAGVLTVVFQDRPERVRRFMEDADLDVPVFLDSDGSFAKRHGIATLPSLLLLRDGEPLYRGPLPVDPVPLVGRHLGLSLPLP